MEGHPRPTRFPRCCAGLLLLLSALGIPWEASPAAGQTPNPGQPYTPPSTPFQPNIPPNFPEILGANPYSRPPAAAGLPARSFPAPGFSPQLSNALNPPPPAAQTAPAAGAPQRLGPPVAPGGFPPPTTPAGPAPRVARAPDAGPPPANFPPANTPPGGFPPANVPPGGLPPGAVPPGGFPPNSPPPNSPPPLGPAAAPPEAASPPSQPMQSLFEPAMIIARVNGEPILAGDVEGLVNQMLAPYVKEAPPDQLEERRKELIRQFVGNIADIKMMYLEFVRELPAERRETGMTEIWSRVYEAFDKEELPTALEKRDFKTPAELDAYLRQFGWSLMKQKRLYGEKQLGQAGVIQKINRNPEVTYDEMLAYYREHQEDYQQKARARWEQLSVHFDKTPNRQAALQQIAEMGNEVFFGAPLAAVAKRRSHGAMAAEGGLHDWVSKGALVSQPLEDAIFSLPLNRLSKIIEDDTGVHIIRVVERTDAFVTPFTETQVEIREMLRNEKREAEFQQVMDEMRRRTTIWTVFDDEADKPQ